MFTLFVNVIIPSVSGQYDGDTIDDRSGEAVAVLAPPVDGIRRDTANGNRGEEKKPRVYKEVQRNIVLYTKHDEKEWNSRADK